MDKQEPRQEVREEVGESIEVEGGKVTVIAGTDEVEIDTPVKVEDLDLIAQDNDLQNYRAKYKESEEFLKVQDFPVQNPEETIVVTDYSAPA